MTNAEGPHADALARAGDHDDMARLGEIDTRIRASWSGPDSELLELLRLREELVERIAARSDSLDVLHAVGLSTAHMEEHFGHQRRLLALEVSELDSLEAYTAGPEDPGGDAATVDIRL